MAEKASDGVGNKHGRTHDCKHLFVSDGGQFISAAENPTLTIVALAIRLSDCSADQMSKDEI